MKSLTQLEEPTTEGFEYIFVLVDLPFQRNNVCLSSRKMYGYSEIFVIFGRCLQLQTKVIRHFFSQENVVF